jgi:hypothetical protein
LVGRPKWQPSKQDRGKAVRLAKLAFTDRQIALALHVDRKTLVRSELYHSIADVRTALRVRLMRPILRDARGDESEYRDPDPRAVKMVLALLSRTDDSSDGPDDAENTDEKAEMETQIDGKA